MKRDHILDALRNGAVLHFSLAEKPRWELYDGTAIRTVSSAQVRCLHRRGLIESADDSLFPKNVPAQTWRYSNAMEKSEK